MKKLFGYPVVSIPEETKKITIGDVSIYKYYQAEDNADIAVNKFGIPIPFAVDEEDRVISLNKNNLIFLLNQFSDEDRLGIMNNYCFGCGTMNLPCHCRNDE